MDTNASPIAHTPTTSARTPTKPTPTRRTRHRHTQSLGLLSPIPSRSSLRSDAGEDTPHTPPSSTTITMSTTPQNTAPPTTPQNTTTAPSTPRSRTRALPALLVGLGHALFPGSAPSSPKVSMGGMPMPRTPVTPTEVLVSRVLFICLLSGGNRVAPQPRRPTRHGHSYSLSLSSPFSSPSSQQQHNTPPRPPSASASTATSTSSRSEQLLRDALRRGSTSSPRPQQHQQRHVSQNDSPLAHRNTHGTGLSEAKAKAYGGDAEGGPSPSAIALTLSRLEGRASSPRPSSRGADPEHEALRARLERVLALDDSASASASPRSSVGSRRGSFVSAGRRVGESPRSSLGSGSASAAREQEEDGEEPMPALLPYVQHQQRQTTPTPRPRTPLSGAHLQQQQQREPTTPRPRTPLSAAHLQQHNQDGPTTPRSTALPASPSPVPRTPTPRAGARSATPRRDSGPRRGEGGEMVRPFIYFCPALLFSSFLSFPFLSFAFPSLFSRLVGRPMRFSLVVLV
ncbi:hypothetical protein B0H16DRAFT_1529395 [Mycena metata]|uniref:Uncharacterized protein n=1 Tax=Mycena metata TaxID=1033252 RepID=A0AAD7NIY2_9AGAR|nr:hypothetical protein B0H16DRAFT_1529395 [Mycena metata]